jgi:hypothetical protein
MARVVPAIHVFAPTDKEDVDARDKRGHDNNANGTLAAFRIVTAAIDPCRDDLQLLAQRNQIGASVWNECSALFVESKKSRWSQRTRSERVLEGDLCQPDRVAHCRGHIQMRARERALFRRQPSVPQPDILAN